MAVGCPQLAKMVDFELANVSAGALDCSRADLYGMTVHFKYLCRAVV